MDVKPVVRIGSLAIAWVAIAMLASPQTATAVEGQLYVDRSFGFSFSTPLFPPSEQEGSSTVAVSLAGPQVGPFAPNVNVVVQNVETTLDAYEAKQQGELKAIGWELLEQSRRQIGGRPALRTHARGPLQGLEVEFVAIAVIRDKKDVVVMTCTATTRQFPLYQAEFDRVLGSFAVEP